MKECPSYLNFPCLLIWFGKLPTALGIVFIAVILFGDVSRAVSGEFSLLGGGERNRAGWSYGYELEYLRRLEPAKPWAFSLATIEDGHFDAPEKHHRDGFVTQFWLLWDVGKRVTLSAGVGPYLYYDTQTFGHVMGVAPIVSADMKIALSRPWFLRLRTNQVFTTSNDTIAVLAGFGRELDSSVTRPAGPVSRPNQLLVMTDGKYLTAGYRRSVLNFVDLGVSFLQDYRKGAYGVGGQLWLVDRCFNDQLKIGLGAGPYYDLRRKAAGWAHQISMVAGYSMAVIGRPYIDVMLQWDRIHTRVYNDEDVLSAGIGYRF